MTEPAPIGTWISAYVSQLDETCSSPRQMRVIRYATLDDELCVYVGDAVGGAARWLAVSDERIRWPGPSTGVLLFEAYDQRIRLRDLYGRKP